MKRLRYLLMGLVIGTTLGLWFGVNIGKDKGLLSNPFAEPTVQQRVKRTSGALLEKGGEALEKSGRALQDKMSE